MEAAYEACLCHELARAGLSFRKQVPIPLKYETVNLECGFRLDLVVEEKVVLELKAVDQLRPIHDCQLLTYLRASGLTLGIILNFNVAHLRHGIRRMVLMPS